MLVMEGGVIDQATTDTAAEATATAEYRPGDAVEYGRRSLVIEEILGNGAFGEVYKANPSDGGAALAPRRTAALDRRRQRRRAHRRLRFLR